MTKREELENLFEPLYKIFGQEEREFFNKRLDKYFGQGSNQVQAGVMQKIAGEYKILKQIAYCSIGMLDAESENNFGDAKDWKFRLKQQIDFYKEKEYDSDFSV